jgi:hypothetical protein
VRPILNDTERVKVQSLADRIRNEPDPPAAFDAAWASLEREANGRDPRRAEAARRYQAALLDALD